MAQTKQAAKKPASKTAAKTTKTRKKSPPPPPPKSPMPRVVGTVLCFFFGIFGIIGFFDVDAWLITYFCGFVKGIIGWGYYVFPAALFICAWVLGFSRDVKRSESVALCLRPFSSALCIICSPMELTGSFQKRFLSSFTLRAWK